MEYPEEDDRKAMAEADADAAYIESLSDMIAKYGKRHDILPVRMVGLLHLALHNLSEYLFTWGDDEDEEEEDTDAEQ